MLDQTTHPYIMDRLSAAIQASRVSGALERLTYDRSELRGASMLGLVSALPFVTDCSNMGHNFNVPGIEAVDLPWVDGAIAGVGVDVERDDGGVWCVAEGAKPWRWWILPVSL